MLAHSVAIYIPTPIDLPAAEAEARAERWANAVKRFLAKRLGGYTAIRARGGYLTMARGVVEQDVLIVRSFATAEGVGGVASHLREAAREIGRDLLQTAIAIEINGAMELVESHPGPTKLVR